MYDESLSVWLRVASLNKSESPFLDRSRAPRERFDAVNFAGSLLAENFRGPRTVVFATPSLELLPRAARGPEVLARRRDAHLGRDTRSKQPLSPPINTWRQLRFPQSGVDL